CLQGSPLQTCLDQIRVIRAHPWQKKLFISFRFALSAFIRVNPWQKTLPLSYPEPQTHHHASTRADPPDHCPTVVGHGECQGDQPVPEAVLAARREALRGGEGGRRRAA